VLTLEASTLTGWVRRVSILESHTFRVYFETTGPNHALQKGYRDFSSLERAQAFQQWYLELGWFALQRVPSDWRDRGRW
jgi:hypothetical protein